MGRSSSHDRKLRPVFLAMAYRELLPNVRLNAPYWYEKTPIKLGIWFSVYSRRWYNRNFIKYAHDDCDEAEHAAREFIHEQYSKGEHTKYMYALRIVRFEFDVTGGE